MRRPAPTFLLLLLPLLLSSSLLEPAAAADCANGGEALPDGGCSCDAGHNGPRCELDCSEVACPCNHPHGQLAQGPTQQTFSPGELHGWEATRACGGLRTTDCGGTTILGGYDVLWDSELRRTFPAVAVGTEIRLTYWFIDSWDGERAYVKLGDRVCWERRHHYGYAPSTDICGWTEHGRFGESSTEVTCTVEAGDLDGSSRLTVTVGADLDGNGSGPRDESFGISSFTMPGTCSCEPPYVGAACEERSDERPRRGLRSQTALEWRTVGSGARSYAIVGWAESICDWCVAWRGTRALPNLSFAHAPSHAMTASRSAAS